MAGYVYQWAKGDLSHVVATWSFSQLEMPLLCVWDLLTLLPITFSQLPGAVCIDEQFDAIITSIGCRDTHT